MRAGLMALCRRSPGSLRGIHDRVMARVRRSPRLAQRLFRLSAPPRADDALWDYTTLVLAEALRRRVHPGMRIWDLGCGPVAILGCCAAELGAGRVLSTDLDPASVESARRAAAHLDQVEVRLADLGEGVEGRFDVIAFNAPYLPVAQGDLLPPHRPRQGAPGRRFLRRLGGGDDGLDTIDRFLDEMPGRLERGGQALLGFNPFYVSPELVLERVARHGLRARGRIALRRSPSIVLVIDQETP